ncbi:helix-turn-helix transcriptional regulator [Ochrobactrum sp. Sa2BUA5]|uniref:Helix-turn-helix transcriptional regulator n=1 Tax=Ochrobactrum quorumnocens TaxID=271865 RepID=A0A5N1JV15_9HYPH|nr:helix-turn-helix transcriptional regulator [[Ochrobactrum] quorumnocens]MBD7992714.1 helix-turn-helix transcriptional regulator [Ochrobactrum gallinarum]
MRIELGMTQEEVAKTHSLARRQVAKLEAGTAKPTRTLEWIGRLFGFAVGFVPAHQAE